MRTLSLAVVALLVVPELADARCARALFGSAVLTSASASVAADGGVIVQSATSFGSNPVGAEDGINPTWRFTDGNKTYKSKLVTLAPGLVVYRPPTGVIGSLSLVDGTTKRATIVRTKDTPAPLAAPEPKTLRLVTERLPRGGSVERIDATFATAAPAGAVAVIVYGVDKQGTKARSWMPIAGGATSGAVAGTAGRCNPGIPGEVVSGVGDKVVLAWVDASGRLSKQSKPITVGR